MKQKQDAEPATSLLTYENLIRMELDGKFKAVERYDSILWKIRSGYIITLYGGLSLLGNKDMNLIAVNNKLLIIALFAWGVSICAFIVDRGFLISKLRVVQDSNALYAVALEVAEGKKIIDPSMLKQLLLNSGESLKRVQGKVLGNAWRSILPLYLITPVFATIAWLVL